MSDEKKDYVFNVNWEDQMKHVHKIGMLAQVDDIYYFFIRSKQKDIAAYKAGFVGISGFEPEKIYRSPELFDFFKTRILDKKAKNPCKELEETRAVSMVDSFSVEKLSDTVANRYKKIIIQAYEIQEEKKELERNAKNEKMTESNDIVVI